MKKLWPTFERVFVCYFVTMGVSLLACVLLNIPMKFILDNYNDLVNFIIGTITLIVSIFILFYIDGYRYGKFEIKPLISSVAMLLVLLIIVIRLIGHAVYISGPTDFLAGYILKESNIMNDKTTMNWYCMGLMICSFVFLYTPLILLGEYLGAKKRKNEFKNI